MNSNIALQDQMSWSIQLKIILWFFFILF